MNQGRAVLVSCLLRKLGGSLIVGLMMEHLGDFQVRLLGRECGLEFFPLGLFEMVWEIVVFLVWEIVFELAQLPLLTGTKYF